MSVGFGLWRVDGKPTAVSFEKISSEERLEDLVADDPSVLGLDVLIVGRQHVTEYGTRLDLLGLDADGDLHVIELKRDRTPRDAVAQLLDYGAWARSVSRDEIASIYRAHTNQELEVGFAERFGGQLPDVLGVRHHLVLVASELDASSERIVNYLASEWGLPVNVVFFRFFQDDGREYLARTWLMELQVSDPDTGKRSRDREPWNGQDFYVTLGEDERRSWEACKRYGYVSGGGGRWYSRTLGKLFVGARVFVYIPGSGYVGAGTVTSEKQPIASVTVNVDGTDIPLLQAPGMPPGAGTAHDDPELSEYVVRVEWLATRPVSGAIWEKGMFANQNTVCELRSRFTLDRLLDGFGLSE